MGILLLVAMAAVLIYPGVPLRQRPAFLALVSIVLVGGLDAYASAAYMVLSLAIYYAPRLSPGRVGSGAVALVVGLTTFLVVSKHLPEALVRYQLVSEFTALWFAPLGVSYFTFKAIHYVVERSRNNLPEHDFSLFLCYFFFFPVISAGPIQRFESFTEGFAGRVTAEDYSYGLARIAVGLFKRFILIEMFLRLPYDRLGDPAVMIQGSGPWTSLLFWAYLGGTFILLYLDFSAYCDLAIGAARLFGVRVVENFNWPILALNIRDFWQRWHRTLSSWCQVYVYMPVLARTRNPYLSVYSSFAVMGLWHGLGWSWLFWGLYHASGVALNAWANRRFAWLRAANSVPVKLLCWGLTMMFVSSAGMFTVVERSGGLAQLPRAVGKLLFLY